MKYGVFMFSTDKAMSVVELARAAEERGFDSVWVPQHVHIPVHRDTTMVPLHQAETLPEWYFRLYDPFVALAAAAAATSTIKIATGICLVPEHEPIALAKRVASLDHISGGRFLFGVGVGWLREEMEPLGTKFEDRWAVTEQRVRAMKALWTEEEGEYHSEFVEVPKTLVYPKPVQQPHPPVYLGARTRRARQHVVDWAEGWLPNRTDPPFVERGMADLRSRAEAAGRDPESVVTTVFGGAEEALDDYERLGVERCVFFLPSEPAAVVLPEVNRLAKLISARV